MAYWFFQKKNNIEVNRTEDIIKETIKELETETQSKVKGKYSQIKYTKSGYEGAVNYLNSLFEKQKWLLRPAERVNETVEVLDDELQSKKDINSVYALKIYSFEIFNCQYRFRIFRLFRSIAFPVRIILDEGIAEELNMSKPGREINSNDEMDSFLREVLKTNKVRNVVNQLLVLEEINSGDVIKEFLAKHKEGATADIIAKNIKWSRALTLDKLNELKEKGVIEVIISNKDRVWKLKS